MTRGGKEVSAITSEDDDKTQAVAVLSKGTVINHYRIIEKIGAGGMGEVYLAEDTSLNRKVALKFLSAHLCQDSDCRARFKREAQAAAKLDHPNIVTVYEVGEFQGRPFFTMQHIEGRSLREYVHGEELTLSQIIEIGIQIAEGLQAAHEKGVTHRDIKPANVLIDAHGRARILDFGLASVAGVDHLTKTGSTLGTVGYMSPEQVRGEKADQRTDLFSFGVVLYELITGHSPFKADSEAATLHAITSTKPELLARYRREVPAEIQTIIDKALEKDVATRYQHADELAADIKRVREATSASSRSQSAVITASPRRRWLAMAAVAGAVVILVTAVWLLRAGGDRAPTPVAKPTQITYDGDVQLVDISPDGSKVAFRRGGEDFNARLYTYSLAGGEPLLVFQGFADDLAWSPDGNSVLAVGCNEKDSSRGVFLIPFMGGSPRFYSVRICDPCRLSWDPKGAAFYYHESCDNPHRFLRFDVKTGDSMAFPLGMPVRWVGAIKYSPKGDRLLLEVESDTGCGIWTCRPDGSDSRRLLDTRRLDRSSTCWSPDGQAVYFMRSTGESMDLMKQRIDAHTGEALGAPRVLVAGLATRGPISTTREGTRLAYVRVEESSTLTLWSRHEAKGRTEYAREIIGSSTVNCRNPQFSPDGGKVAFVTMRNNEGMIRIFSVRGRTTRTLDVAGRNIAACVWSPDGSTLAILYDEKSVRRVCLADANSGSLLQIPSSWANLNCSEHISWAPLDKILIQDVGNRNFYKLDPKSDRIEKLFPDDSIGWKFFPAPSAHGEVAIKWNEVNDGIYRVSLDGTQRARMVKFEFFDDEDEPLCWSDDDKNLYWAKYHGRYILRTSRDGAVTDTVLDLGPDAPYRVAMTRDAALIFTIKNEVKKDAWLIEDFDPDVK